MEVKYREGGGEVGGRKGLRVKRLKIINEIIEIIFKDIIIIWRIIFLINKELK